MSVTDARQAALDQQAGLRCLREQDGSCRVATPRSPPPFMVFDATDEQLLGYGFGPKPRDPVLFRLWHKMYHSQPAFADTRLRRSSPLTSMMFRSGVGDAGPDRIGAAHVGRTRIGSSANWSGAVILANGGLRAAQIGARWVVPAVTAGVGSAPWACSTWIGVDGLRRWMKSMPQMGTTQSLGSVAPPGVPNYAWVQWWLRDKERQEPVVIEDFVVEPGHEVSCLMSLIETTPGDPSTQQVRCEISNLDTGIAAKPIIMTPPMNEAGRLVPTGAASAQWILERPTALVTDGAVLKDERYPLPRFATFRFHDIAADFAVRPGAASTIPRDLTAPRLIRMRKRATEPPRTAVIAVPKRQAARVRLDVSYTETD